MASLVASLAWPVVIAIGVCAAWVKRGEIISLVGSNGAIAEGRRLKRFKAGPVELEWETLIQATAEHIDRAAPVAAPSPQNRDAEDAPSQDTGHSGAGIPPEAVGAISSIVPTAAVLEEFARIESRLREMLREAGEEIPSRGNARVLIRRALNLDLISPELANIIDNLAKLRNEAAHRVGGADISTEQARQYLELAERVLTALGVSTGFPVRRPSKV